MALGKKNPRKEHNKDTLICVNPNKNMFFSWLKIRGERFETRRVTLRCPKDLDVDGPRGDQKVKRSIHGGQARGE